MNTFKPIYTHKNVAFWERPKAFCHQCKYGDLLKRRPDVCPRCGAGIDYSTSDDYLDELIEEMYGVSSNLRVMDEDEFLD